MFDEMPMSLADCALVFAYVADGGACRCPGRIRGRVRGDPRSPGAALALGLACSLGDHVVYDNLRTQ